MANQPILDNSNDPFGSFSGSVERTATSPDQVDAVLARARMRDHQALQKQLGMGAATPALGIQAPLVVVDSVLLVIQECFLQYK